MNIHTFCRYLSCGGIYLLILIFFLWIPTVPAAPIESATHVTLENGLQVILMENHTSPLITSTVIVKTGVRNETPDINGVSHLLEHLLFNGTSTRTQKQLYDEVDFYGAYNNASTSRDYTLFQMLVRKDYITQILNIQADMLFNSIFPEENVQKERNIVIEEIKGSEMNSPSAEAEKFFNAKLYRGTSYTLPGLGTPELISTIPRDKILAYYHRFYRPDNMILVLMGDFETQSILEIARKEFDVRVNQEVSTAQSSGIQESVLPDLKIQGRKVYTKRLESQGNNLSTPTTYLNIALNAPHISDPDFYAFSVWTFILNSGELPEFNLKNLNALGIQDLQVNLDFNDQFSFLIISATLSGDSDADQVLQQILTKLDRLKTRSLSQEVIEKALVKPEVDEILQSEQYHYYTFYKAPYLAAAPFEKVRDHLKNLKGVTPRALQTVANKYFTNPPVLATLVGTKQKDEERELKWKSGKIAGPETGKPEELPTSSTSHAPILKREIFDNGLTVIVKENPDTEVFAFHLLAKDRKALEPKGKSGIAEFLHRMLLQGTKYRSFQEISADLNAIGATLKVTDDRSIPYDDYYFSPAYSYLRFETTARQAYEGLMQLADLIKNPKFDPEQVERVRAQLLNDLREDQGSTRIQARNLFYQTLLGDDPLARPILGEEQDVKSITVEDLRQFHRTYFAPHNLILSVVSGLPAEKVMGRLKFYFADLPTYPESKKEEMKNRKAWERERMGMLETQGVERTKEKKIVEREMGKGQSYIYLGNLFSFKEADEVAITVMNAILSDRIAFNLREKQGLAYVIGSSVSFYRGIGWFQVFMGTRPENLSKAQQGLIAEVKKFQAEEVSPEELKKTVNRLLGSMLMRRMTSIQQAYFLGLQEFQNKPLDTEDRLVERVQKLTPADIHRIANTYLDSEKYVMVTVK